MYLTVDVSSPTFKALRLAERVIGLGSEVLCMGSDWSAWVVSCEADGSVQRMLIPLFGMEASKFMTCAARGQAFIVFTSSAEDSTDSLLEFPLEASGCDLQLIRRHWRSRMPPDAPYRIIQALDVLLKQGGTSNVPRFEVVVVLPTDLRGELADLMPEWCFDAAP